MHIATPSQDRPNKAQTLAGRTYRMMREAHGLTLREMAEAVGVTAGHLSRVESGERAASPSLEDRIVDTLATLPARSA